MVSRSKALYIRRIDPLTGFYLYQGRHYIAVLGRWGSRDPIEEYGGVNLYSFSLNNVLNYKDKNGLVVLEHDGELFGEPLEDLVFINYGVTIIWSCTSRFKYCCHPDANMYDESIAGVHSIGYTDWDYITDESVAQWERMENRKYKMEYARAGIPLGLYTYTVKNPVKFDVYSNIAWNVAYTKVDSNYKKRKKELEQNNCKVWQRDFISCEGHWYMFGVLKNGDIVNELLKGKLIDPFMKKPVTYNNPDEI